MNNANKEQERYTTLQQSSREILNDLSTAINTAGSEARGQWEQLRTELDTTLQNAAATMDDLQNRGKDAGDEVVKGAKKSLDELNDALTRAQDRLSSK